MNKRQIENFVRANRLELKRIKGSHKIYKTQDGRTISLKDEMAKPVLQRLAKEHNLII